MSEFAELRADELITELEHLEKLQIFRENEIRAIVNMRKSFDYNLRKETKCRDDYIKYIKYEMDLLKLVKTRRKKMHKNDSEADIDMSIANRINKLFKQAIFQFHDDISLWLSYIKFCEQVKVFSVCVSYMLVGMLSVHSHKPSLWKLAATWEFEANKSIENARQFFLRGLKHHPDSKILYTEAFRMELVYTELKRKQLESKDTDDCVKFVAPSSPPCIAAVRPNALPWGAIEGCGFPDVSLANSSLTDHLSFWQEMDSSGVNDWTNCNDGDGSDLVSECRIAERVYESASRRIPDVSFLINLLNIAKKFSFTEKLQSRIVRDLTLRFPKDELMWDALARRQLEGVHNVERPGNAELIPEFSETMEITEESDSKLQNNQCSLIKQRIRSCCLIYQLGLQHLCRDRMWGLYLDALIDINKDVKILRKYKRKLLRCELQKAHLEGHLQEKYYIYWASILSNKKEKLSKVLCAATEKFPSSMELWEMRLQCHLAKGEEEAMMTVFKHATNHLKTAETALPLWKTIIQYWQLKSRKKVEEIYREGIAQCPEVSSVLKPMFLEWLVLAKDIRASRQVYRSLCSKPPFCREMHNKMAQLETIQPEVDLTRIVRCYELACEQFGRDNIDVWMEYVKFEKRQGDAAKVKELYQRALSILDEGLAHNFISEFCESWIVNNNGE